MTPAVPLTGDVEVLQVDLEHELVFEHEHLSDEVVDLVELLLAVVLHLAERQLPPLGHQLVVRPRDHAAHAVPRERRRRTKKRFRRRGRDHSEEGRVGDDLARGELVLAMVEQLRL